MIILSIVFIFIGFYGGFIQAGVGFLIIIFLTLLNKEMLLVEMHSVKTVVVTIYLLISTFVFIYNGQINWSYALVLSIGSGIGGWIGRSEEHTSELQSRGHIVCRLLLEKKKRRLGVALD